MADQRVTAPVKVIHSADLAELSVSNGNAHVILAANTGIDIGDVDVLSVIPGVGPTNLGKAVDSPIGGTDTGIAILGVKATTLAATTPIAGDYDQLRTDANGALWTVLGDALPAGTNNIGDVDILSIVPGVGPTNLGKAEDALHVTGDTGIQMLAVRNDTPSSLASATGEYIPLTTDALGRLHVTDPNAGAGNPTAPTKIVIGPVSLTAGTASIAQFRTVDFGTAVKKLSGVDVSSSVALKIVINSVINNVVTTIAVLFARPGENVSWRPPHKDFASVSFTASVNFEGFELLVTNMDTADTADAYATIFYED